MAVLLVRHDLAEVPPFGRDILVINAGHVLERERTKGVVPEPQHRIPGRGSTQPSS